MTRITSLRHCLTRVGVAYPSVTIRGVVVSSLVSLKVLNSIVLLGKSCVYVKRAKMEDKLFDRPATPRPPPGKADQEPSPAPSGNLAPPPQVTWPRPLR